MIALAALSAWASVADARRRVIPNLACVLVASCGLCLQLSRLLAPGALAALPLTHAVAAGLPAPASCLAWGAGSFVGGLGLEWLLRAVSGRAGLGLGDVKYLASWALTLGWLVLPALAGACLAGAACALARRRRAFALGPWLSAAFLAACALAG